MKTLKKAVKEHIEMIKSRLEQDGEENKWRQKRKKENTKILRKLKKQLKKV
jgi:hypothetical protein